MTMLDGPRLQPASGKALTSLVILLHGYGSNGADMISLAPQWRSLLPNTAFVAPNAPEPCPGMPGGRQWWGLSSFDRAALTAGARRAAPMLDAFIDAEMSRFGLEPDRVLLVGFSQGTMMALHVGPRRLQPLAGIIGYSGMLADPALREAEVTSRPPVLLIHGEADPLVPLRGSREAERELRRVGFAVSLQVQPRLAHSVNQAGIRAGGKLRERCSRIAAGSAITISCG